MSSEYLAQNLEVIREVLPNAIALAHATAPIARELVLQAVEVVQEMGPHIADAAMPIVRDVVKLAEQGGNIFLDGIKEVNRNPVYALEIGGISATINTVTGYITHLITQDTKLKNQEITPQQYAENTYFGVEHAKYYAEETFFNALKEGAFVYGGCGIMEGAASLQIDAQLQILQTFVGGLLFFEGATPDILRKFLLKLLVNLLKRR